MRESQSTHLLDDAKQCFEESKLSEAEAMCGRLLQNSAASAPALHLAARIAEKMGRNQAAIEFLERAACASPADAAIRADLGFMYARAGRVDDAATALDSATRLDPQLVEPWVHLGDLRAAGGQMQAAAEAYCQAALLRSDDADVFAHIGGNCGDPSALDRLFADCLAVLRRAPLSAVGWFNFGFAAQVRGSIDVAIQSYRTTLELQPEHALARNNLGAALRDTGQIDAAAECFRMAADATCGAMTCHSNLLYLMHFQEGMDPVSLRREHERWNLRYATGLSPRDRAFENDRSPDRRLRIGYVSPNFYQHSVGRFLIQLFDHHDREAVETFIYASVRHPDALTNRLRNSSDCWIDALAMSDEALAERVREDKIDILVDLTMHMRDQRLLCFARKPAPIQATYLAYCATTGMDAIDYRLTDPHLDPFDTIHGGPAGERDAWYVERSMRLPECYWCYEPGISTPEANPLPALTRGYVTFASLNNFCKVSAAALSLWSQLLTQIADSRLLLHAHRGAHRGRVLDFFAQRGVVPERIVFVDTVALAEYFALYQLVDISLDSFPYAGGTTTCDALWMGVPVISLVGEAAIARGGLSILSNVRLPQFATQSTGAYLRLAAELASDLPRLGELRRTLRARLQQSPVMNGPRFARGVEACYRSMWMRWLSSGAAH
jgi:protein O-GlcNAc transferase